MATPAAWRRAQVRVEVVDLVGQVAEEAARRVDLVAVPVVRELDLGGVAPRRRSRGSRA